MKKLTKKDINFILDNLYLIIDINRIGSDEIEILEDIISNLERKKIKDIQTLDLLSIQMSLIELTEWSDRLGSDEYHILEEINLHIMKLIK